MENRDWDFFRNGEPDSAPNSSSPLPDGSVEENLTDTEPNEGQEWPDSDEDIFASFQPESFLPQNSEGVEPEESDAGLERSESDESIFADFRSGSFMPQNPEEAEPEESDAVREQPELDEDIYPSFQPESFMPKNPEEVEPEEPDAGRERSESDEGVHYGLDSRDTTTVAPVYYAKNNDRARGRVKKKHTAVKVIGLLIVFIFLIAACEILSGFDISIISNSSGIEIVLKDRNADDSLWYGGGVPPTIPEDNSPVITSGEGPEVGQVSIYPAGDGTTLEISQISGGKYTLQEIYDKCIVSIVLVNVGLQDGYGTGTGIIMSEDGYIITNEHVIDGATSIDIELQDGTAYTAALVGKDSQTDLAVLKIDANNLLPARFGDSSDLRVGDEVAAIGNPLGLNFSLSNGIISALDRDVEVNGYYMTMIQTNVAINEGNSGGALINMYGQVIGITNMKLVSYSAYSSIEGMAFAIPTSVVKPAVDSIIDQGFVSGRPALGIMCATLDAAAAESEGLPRGVYVSSIYKESSAFGKLETGDVITAANGVEVLSNEDLNEIKNGLGVGDTLTLTVFRDGETLDIDIVLIDAALIEY